MSSPDTMKKTYAEKNHSKIESGMKLSQSEQISNLNVSDKANKEHILSGQVKEKNEDVSSKNILGKSVTAVRRSTDAIKNMAKDMDNEGSEDNVIVERSFALTGSASKTAVKATKGLVKSVRSVASLESTHKIRSKYTKNNAVNEQVKEMKGVKKTEKKQRNDLHSTYGIDKSEKLLNKNKEKKKLKNEIAKQNEKANRKEFIKDYTRKKIINNLIKPESDKENNMSTGFGAFVAVIAKRYMDGFFKGLVKVLLGAIAQAFSIFMVVLFNAVLTLMPIILPVAAVVGAASSLFGFLFGDTSAEQADASYCVTVLSSKYDDFNRASKSWIDQSTVSTTGGTTYSIEYVNGCAYLDNFQDALLLYVVLSADNYSSGTTSTDNSYLVVDTDEETAAMNKAFSMLTYAEESGVVRKVTRLTLADVESQLTEEQKKMLEFQRGFVADGGSLGLGERVVGEYGDNVGAGSNVAVSPNASIAVEFAKSKVGNPYSQAQRDDGYHFDCSSLVYYAWKEAGVNISPGSTGAGTTETEVKWAEENGKVISTDNLQPGDLIFLSTKENGRYKNITHVVMYIGDNQVVHASSPKSGVKISKYNYWKPEQFVEAVRPN